jgi:hypothetical protein
MQLIEFGASQKEKAVAKITGRVIRIVDNRTAIINLGSQDGINEDSIFHILGEPESIIDPFSEEDLGTLRIVKAKLKANQVYERFTVVTTQWQINTLGEQLFGNIFAPLKTHAPEERVTQGELRVNEAELQPWKATFEEAVRVGDYVEVEIEGEREEVQAEVDTEEEVVAEELRER